MSKIFIIEDEQAIIELVKYNLEKEGYRVSYSNKGDSGISEIKQIEPDLILLDWMLPDISGIEVFSRILSTIIFGIFQQLIYHGVFLQFLGQFLIYMKVRRTNISFPFSL